MTEQHPITPPPELVEKWCHKWTTANGDFGPYLATQAARWGFDQRTVWDAEWLEVQLQRARDQELEACCEWLQDPDLNVDTYKLRAARRRAGGHQ